ncbi:glycosyltransferase family 2 protein [Roseateles saccharophilus]|uniref:Undecaprenyl-phosphate 4-deoxy-4-formamido-L-arabinose transferase n=1 Tax=Roseateles saccharophilus TaxID=304 RepID=A0A4R3UIX6_ROSSA|nr:glycosyltransferase family 2 protein [Roseateles saccharophilus]MDG0835195.1 glycosyltransferase [Roseateles saccharophilus]TCU87836.1 undecaprenyl-phosphate 4-deoxy-4-formamido-L-arabinose transferase [Roseateles saccharophilus]
MSSQIGDEGLSVVVPVFRSREGLHLLHTRLTAALERLGRPFEILLVEDGGHDGSWEEIVRLATQDDRIRGLRMGRNFGQHNALLAGIRAARQPLIVTLDDDLQNPPEEIHKLLARLGEGFDVVYGKPAREQHGFLRDMASRVTKLVLQQAMGASTARHVSAFRVFRTRLRDAFATYRSPFLSLDVLLTWGSSRFSYVEVQHDERKLGESGYSLRKLIAHAFNMVTGFSTAPLQAASWIGFVFTLFGLGVLVFVVASYFINGVAVPGFAFLASIVAIFSGAQLFALGIIGEYLARMHFRTMERPTYLITEQVGPLAGMQPANPLSAVPVDAEA